jgi:hypothetical protein
MLLSRMLRIQATCDSSDLGSDGGKARLLKSLSSNAEALTAHISATSSKVAGRVMMLLVAAIVLVGKKQ